MNVFVDYSLRDLTSWIRLAGLFRSHVIFTRVDTMPGTAILGRSPSWRGITAESRSQLGLPAYSRERIRVALQVRKTEVDPFVGELEDIAKLTDLPLYGAG